MTAVQTRGAGRRLTQEQEARGRELFGEGRTEREVARALGVGASTAHRIRERAEAAAREAAPATPAAQPAGEQNDTGVIPSPAPAGPEEPAETLEALRDRRDKLAAQHGALLDQAQAAREAVEDCDTRRVEALAGGGDSARFAAERTRLEAEHARLSADAGVVGGWLLEAGAAIEHREALRELAALRRELVTVAAERDTVCSRTGERMRAAVLAVRDAAAEFAQALADDQAAVARAEELAAAVTARAVALGEPAPAVPAAVSTAVSAPYDAVAPEPLALARAIGEARIGNVAAVARQLGVANGWLPPDPALIEAERQRILALHAQQPPASVPPSLEGEWDPRLGASVSVDGQGNPLRPPDPERPRPQQVVRPGSLGFAPWPG